jgi:hypothetical protein
VNPRALVSVTACALALSTLAGCAKPYDYTNFRQHRPRSILVMPPRNESRDADAAWSYQSTVTRPLAERGYYVFPVAVVDRLMKDGVSPSKAAEILGADAVLYVTLEEYGTKQQVLNAATLVKLRARLVDARSGLLLWERRFAMQHNSNFGSGGILGDSTEAAHNLAGPANVRFFGDRDQGLLYGPYHPRYGKDE